MHRGPKLRLLHSLPTFALGASLAVFSQSARIEPDMKTVVEGKLWKIFNRAASLGNEGGRATVLLDARPGDGVVFLEGSTFDEGTVEVDLKGKNVFQQSFLGIAFHATDEKSFDAVYFRPFNFRSEDPARRSHAVQYISHPIFTWQKLRAERPGEFEKPVQPVPDPEKFFHARIVVQHPKIMVYVENAQEPCLVVDELAARKGGMVGLWVGNGSDGTFANLKIIPRTSGK